VEYLSACKCLSGLIEFEGGIYCLAVKPGLEVIALQLQSRTEGAQVVEIPIAGLSFDPVLEQVRMPIKSRREIYWLSDLGQIVLKMDAQSRLSAGLLKWPESVAPLFSFGGAYLNTDGSLWQQCIDSSSDDEDEYGYCFLELGKQIPDKKRVGTYRLLAGSSCMVKDYRMARCAPWETPPTLKDGIKNIVVPLLESTEGTGPLICASARFNGDPSGFFANQSAMLVEYLFWGHVAGSPNLSCVFHSDKVETPWNARLFIFQGCLFLYDPDNVSREIPGWKISQKAEI
jgi:hypothetical protein